MDASELQTKLTELYELINQILPVEDEAMQATPQQWRELNELTRQVADGTQSNADYWREVANREGKLE